MVQLDKNAEPTGREIERKYLLSALPAGIAELRSVEIDQGYLPGTRIRERIRRIRDGASTRYVRTIKTGAGVERLEFEEDTTEAFFDTVWPLTAGRRVHKRRYVARLAGADWEIDEFLDRTLALAEIELTRADEPVEMPAVIASVLVREVTDEPSFTNYHLAR
jgi:CYTH domain-containing protein